MKLHDYKADRRGNDSVRLSATWTDHMRRPAEVKITYGPLQFPTAEPQLLVEGDTKQTTDVLFAVAEMAWEMGWRPRGMAGFLAQIVNSYKIPKDS